MSEFEETGAEKQTISSMILSNDYKYINLTTAQFGVTLVNKGNESSERVVIHIATPRFIPTKSENKTTTKAINSALVSLEMDRKSAQSLQRILNKMIEATEDAE